MGNFVRKNEAFTCLSCQKEVPKAKKTCRNHCPYCLHSRHLDHMPGDRQHPCKGLMAAFAYEAHPKKGVVLWFLCHKCQDIRSNIAILEDDVADDYEKILKLSGKAPSRPSKS